MIKHALLVSLLLPCLSQASPDNCTFTIVNYRHGSVHFANFHANDPSAFADIFKNGKAIAEGEHVTVNACPQVVDNNANMDVDILDADNSPFTHLMFRPYISSNEKGFIVTVLSPYGNLETRLWQNDVVRIPPL